MKSVRWIYVAENGDEFNYDEPQTTRPTLKVETVGKRERTWTRHHAETGMRVHPRGEGWSFENDDGFSSSWVRQKRQ